MWNMIDFQAVKGRGLVTFVAKFILLTLVWPPPVGSQEAPPAGSAAATATGAGGQVSRGGDEDAIIAFERELDTLQRALAGTSASVLSPLGSPNDLNAFLNSPSADIGRVASYYSQLMASLNNLNPTNPYAATGPSKTQDIVAAEQGLRSLTVFDEDEMISRILLNHIQAVRGEHRNDKGRISEIDREIARKEVEIRRKEWNLENEGSPNLLSGKLLGGNGGAAQTLAEILNLKEQLRALVQERAILTTVRNPLRRRAQFQLFILELTSQQRYIHALIACGFYRYLSSDTTFDPQKLEEERSSLEAENREQNLNYQTTLQDIRAATSVIPNAANTVPLIGIPPSSGESSGSAPAASTSPSTAQADTLPQLNSITGLETFLTTKIMDCRRKRQSFDGMISGKRYGLAQALLIDLHATARHQPELHTIPVNARHEILSYGNKLRQLSEALTSLDYEAVKALATEAGEIDSMIGIVPLKAFAEKYPVQGRVWARQAEILSRSGKFQEAGEMMKFALQVAPLDKEVQETLKTVQDDLLEKREVLESLKRVVKDGNYRDAFDRAEEFSPLAEGDGDPDLKRDFDSLVNLEKDVQASLEKSKTLENRGEYAAAWLEVTEVPEKVSGDSRFVSRRGELSTRSADFAKGYYSAKDFEKSGKDAIALSWYLNLVDEAPGSDVLNTRIEDLSRRVGRK
jgi:tetratricopeptide (TPR) repeat protein